MLSLGVSTRPLCVFCSNVFVTKSYLLCQASILLRPGKYLMSETIELCEEELDIIGDIDENEEVSDIAIYCKGIVH